MFNLNRAGNPRPLSQKISSLSAGVLAVATTLAFSACHSGGTKDAVADSTATSKPALPTFTRNPEFRDHVKKEPVAEYKVRTENKLNELYFSVRLYETNATMKYRVAMDFEGLTGEDTVKLPDMGTPPHPELQKGPEKYSCIIGLLDNDKKFRELKKVYVTEKGQQLKITTLRHYVVTDDYRLVGK